MPIAPLSKNQNKLNATGKIKYQKPLPGIEPDVCSSAL
jgi:hypothetical protein